MRGFLNPLICLVALFSTLPLSSYAALDPTKDKILYVTGTAHLDDQWNWTIRDTIDSYIPKTLRDNFTLFTNYPGYTFSFEEAWRYDIIREYYPAQFLTMSNYIAQGRWRVTGSSLVAGDVNVPSPESLIRQILYAQKYWQRTFGKTSEDIFLPDCFGFGYALPSIASHCGLKGFSTQKLTWGSAIPVPFQNIGRWIGPDGGSVVAVLNPGSYVSTITGNLANDSFYANRIDNMNASTGLKIDYRYFGTGDTGGSPDTASVDWLQQSVTTSNGLINVVSAGADQVFRDLTPAMVDQLPTYNGELLLKTHSTGCYTAHPEAKRYNKQNEMRADAAERSAVIADWLQGGGTYPQDALNKAWARFLWHQFHDDLTGTSIPEAYRFSWNDYALSLNEFKTEQVRAASVLAQAMDTTGQGVPIMVVNSLGRQRTDVVETVVRFPGSVPQAVRVFDAAGNEVPSQAGTASSNSLPLLFVAAVPPNGSALYDVRPAASPSSLSTGLSVSSSHLENQRYRVNLDSNGDVSSVYDKTLGRQLLSAPIRWEFLYNRSTTWPAWEILYDTTAAAPKSYLGAPARVEIVENGPARVCLAVTRGNGGSLFQERISLSAGDAGDKLEWDVTATWATKATLLKVRFPLAVSNSKATYDLGLGTIQRTNSQANLYEVPAQQWVDLTHSNGANGVTLISDSRFGWDKPDDNTLRLTIFHTPEVGGNYVYAATNGFGVHRFGFGLMGHAQDWRAGSSPWVAARFSQPLQAFQTLVHSGSLGKTFSFLNCDNSNVMIKAVKKAEDSNEIVVRLQELVGYPQNAVLTFAAPVLSARLMTGAEEPLTTLTPVDGNLSVSLGAYSPVTLAVTLAPAAAQVSKPESQPVALPFNLDVISSDANRADGAFASGLSYPAELMPAAVTRGGVVFNLGPTNDGALNAVSCQGQTIPLNGSGYTHLHILAASASNVTSGTFTVNGQATNLAVPYFTGFMGQWNPPSLIKDEIGWLTTHRHTATANDSYRFCYLYKYCLALPSNATSLVLPNAPNIRIFAASLTKGIYPEIAEAGGILGENLPPWANAGASRRVNAPNTTGPAQVILDGRLSMDPDGSIRNYLWSINGTTIGEGTQPQVALPIGTNNVLLTVTDDRGAIGLSQVSITVVPPLVVSVSAGTPSGASAPASVTFTGQVSVPGLSVPAYDTTDDGIGTITAQGQNSPNEFAIYAFDNLTSTKWLDFASDNASTRSSWIQYAYPAGVPYVVTNYTITSANDASARDPSAWALLGSNDGGSTWTTLDTRTNQTFSDRLQKRSFGFSNTTAFSVYRLRIDRVANPASANSVQLAEIELLGTPRFVYLWSFGDGTTSSTSEIAGNTSIQHLYTNNGTFTVRLAASLAGYTGTNFVPVSIGQPLAIQLSANPASGALPLHVQFTAQASAGSGGLQPYDSTDDGLGIITAQGENAPNEAVVKLFDNNPSTKWLDFANANPASRSSWVQYQYPNGQTVALSEYSITSAGDALTYPARNPAAWRLLGSNNEGASWETLDTRSDVAFTGNMQKQKFPVSNTNAFNLYRFQVDSVFNPTTANSVQIAELELITSPPPYLYTWFFGDGSVSSDQNPQHSFLTAGDYQVSVVAWDGLSMATNWVTVSVAPPPALAWGPAGPGELTLSWPTNAPHYQVETTSNLNPPADWEVLTNVAVPGNGLLNITIPAGNTNRFFRLRAEP